jgi:hypothetical protein
MSRQFRYRVTALVVGGLIFGAPLLTNGTASAEQLAEEQTVEGGRQVVFEGGSVFDLNCRSRPDIEKMVVPADSRVRVVNRTGYAAKLLLSGTSKGTLPDDASTEVLFRRGTTSVLLEPNCPLGNATAPAMITATPSAATMPDPTPAPTGGAGGASASGAAPSAADSPATSGPASAVLARPARVTPSSGTRSSGTAGSVRTTSSTVGQAAAAVSPGMPQGGVTSRVRARNPQRTAAGGAPAFAGMPPGDKKALLPGVPGRDVPPTTPDDAPAASGPTPAEIAAAEPVATMRQMPDSAPIGVLGLIASICVMGVGAAAIRAIVSQRANRAKVA